MSLDELAGPEVGDISFPYGHNAAKRSYNPIAENTQASAEGKHWCPCCKDYVDSRLFYPVGDETGHKDSYCRTCRAAKAREWSAAHKETHRARVRASQIKCVYGVTQEQVDARFAEQGYCCAICKATSPGKLGWCIEHDHITKVFRGVVCHACNLTIGNAKESIERLLACAEYLHAAAQRILQ